MQASNASYDDNVTIIEEAKDRAENGSLSDMALLARWHLLNEVEGIKRNAIEGYEWSKKAAEGGDCNGMAYRAIWLIHGDREIKKKRDEGVELLVKAANEGSAFAAYKLGSYYSAGVHGFKEDRKNAEKWLRLADEHNSKLNEMERENVKKYFLSNAPVVTTSVPTVPEHIDIGSNNSVGINQRMGDGTEIDSLSLSMTCTTVSMTNMTGLSSVAGTNVTTLSSHSNNATDPQSLEQSSSIQSDLRLGYRNHATI